MMLKIENYKKLEGLMFGEWKCGIAEEHGPLYRFSFHKGNGIAHRQTFWIEVERNVFTDEDGDRVVTINFPRRKLITRMSIKYMRHSYNVTKNFTKIIQNHA